jgi:UDP-GlcNAc:undecaprenyl-phosphate/decaprenyl-phosphate GlcNAc-1-phosphate transferase
LTSPAVLLTAPFSFIAALFFTPLVRRFAARTGYIDHPAPRKHHPEPTPLLGGVAVAAALVVGPVLAKLIAGADVAWPRAGVLCGAALSLGLGLVDDRHPMRPLGKLLGQIAAALLLVFWGARGGALAQHPVWAAAAIVGVVALLNAINFLDAMDGIVASVVPIAAAGFLALSLLFGADVDQALGWALIGAGAGFLVYNAPPARIFLGDAGSHLLGFALAALALEALDNSLTLPHVVAVLCILSYPLFDVIFVTWDRVAGRRPIAVGSTDHSTHRLGRICGRWGTVALISAVVTATTALGVGVWNAKNSTISLAAVSILGLGYAVFGTYLRRKRPTPLFDT